MKRFGPGLLLLIALAGPVVGCGEPAEVGDDEPLQEGDGDGPGENGEKVVLYPQAETYPVARCDDLDLTSCAFPWPSNLYLAPDERRSSGYALRFDEGSLPSNRSGVALDPGRLAHLDGYDLGVPIMVGFPGLQEDQLISEYQIQESLHEEALIRLFEVSDQGLRRLSYWTELDLLEPDEDKRILFVRPGEILKPATRYLVAIQGLTDQEGVKFAPSEAFDLLRQGRGLEDPILQYRQERFEEIFSLLEQAGLHREELQLAWDFQTASSEALHGPMLSIREAAFQYIEDEGITWSFDEVVEYAREEDGTGRPVHTYIGLELRGTIEVPHFMTPYEEIPNTWVLARDEEGQITQNGTRQAPILVRIPHRALNGDPVGILIYGHGLLGSRWELHAPHLGRLAEEYGYMQVAVDLVGMSGAEGVAAAQSVVNANHFVTLSDRLHQGLLEYLLASHAARMDLPNLEELISRGIEIDLDHHYFMGASQGGIFGATFMALSTHIERGYLAVPGNNYSTLLHRSTNFVEFNSTMARTYRESAERNQVVAFLGLLWSTTEPVSFLRHLRKEPFDGVHRDVLLAVAKGDWQVATITNEVLARSGLEIPLMENYDRERSPYGVEVATYPHRGSGTVLFDFGNPWPAPGNDHPRDELGDPHGWLSSVDVAGIQLDHFLRQGEIIDVCDEKPCQFDPPN